MTPAQKTTLIERIKKHLNAAAYALEELDESEWDSYKFRDLNDCLQDVLLKLENELVP
jgi:hypothetical protein